MTRTYAAKRLLEHGQLTMSEFREITGWSKQTAHMTMLKLIEYGLVVRRTETGTRRYIYRLAA